MEEEKYYRLLREAEKISLMGSWEKNLETGKLIWSDGLYHIYGLEPGSIPLTTEYYIGHYIHPDDREKMSTHIQRIYEGSSEPLEYRIVTNEGEKTVLSQPSPRLEEKICRGIVRDITHQKKSEHAMLGQNRFVENIANTSPDVISVVAFPSRKLEYINRDPLLNLGYTPEELLSVSEEERRRLLVHPDDAKGFRDYYDRMEKAPDSRIEVCEYRAVKKSGEIVWLHSRGKVFERNSEGKPTSCLNIIQNISLQKESEAELVRLKLDQQKQVLNAILLALEQERARIGEALHDGVAQLLFAIQTRLQLLKPFPEDEKNIRELLEIVNEAITDTRNISFELVPSVLRDYGIETGLRALFKRIVKNKPRLEFECSGLEKRLNGNLEFAIYRIVQELVNNVLRHSKATEVSVSIRLQRGKLLISVMDNGIGFNQKHVKTTAPGTGVQSVKNRVLLLDGKLRITSTKERGTKITVSIPVN